MEGPEGSVARASSWFVSWSGKPGLSVAEYACEPGASRTTRTGTPFSVTPLAGSKVEFTGTCTWMAKVNSVTDSGGAKICVEPAAAPKLQFDARSTGARAATEKKPSRRVRTGHPNRAEDPPLYSDGESETIGFRSCEVTLGA